jgi:LPS-assembly lipoprotein
MWCIHNFRVAIILATVLAAVAGCGFRPLHGTGGGGARDQLATVRITQIPDRVGQKLHNLLLDWLTPEGPPATPHYVLSVSLREARQNLAIRKDETATRANLTLTAAFSLRRLGLDEKYVGTAVSTNSYNILQSDFATLSAENDARDRALRVLAEEIRTRVATALTNPVFFKSTATK